MTKAQTRRRKALLRQIRAGEPVYYPHVMDNFETRFFESLAWLKERYKPTNYLWKTTHPRLMGWVVWPKKRK